MSTTSLPLTGLRADRLLAVLALFGLMRTLATARPDWQPRVAWQGPPWHPVLTADTDLDEGTVAHAAVEGLTAWAPAFDFDGARDINHTPKDFRKWAEGREGAAATVAAALASDAATNRDGTRVTPTALCALFGQGHQHFLERLADGVAGAAARPDAANEIDDALMRWRYEPEGVKRARGQPPVAKGSFRWDPAEDRRYALQAEDPSSETGYTVPGANRLAALGLTLLPVVPGQTRLQTTATLVGADGTQAIRWPVWTAPLDLAALRALLDHPNLVAENGDPDALRPLGVAAVYGARRLQVDRYVNFAPAEPVWDDGGAGPG